MRGEALAEPAAPVRDGYTFDGWYKEEGLTNKVVFPYSTEGFTANFTLYAGWTEEDGLAAIATELGEDADYSLFAAALADVSAESGSYTVFALPNSVIEADTRTRTLSAADVQWHIVRGKYGTEELLQAQTLQTVGGQTLTVACETVEIAGEEEMFLYINDIPLDYRSVRLMDGGAVYSIGSNIARISDAPGTDDLDAYNSWAAMAMEGTWIIRSVEKRRYHIWNNASREETPFMEERDNTHVGCREVFERDPAKVSQGCAGTYETLHSCGGDELGYYNNGHHGSEGWWSVDASGIVFHREMWAGGPLMTTDQFIFANGIGREIKCVSSYGDDVYYGGDEPTITGTYYETEYTLLKVAN